MEDRAVHLIAVRFVPLDIDVGILRLEGVSYADQSAQNRETYIPSIWIIVCQVVEEGVDEWAATLLELVECGGVGVCKPFDGAAVGTHALLDLIWES